VTKTATKITMLINQIITELELMAPPSYQENYDNAGLITGQKNWVCTGVLCSLDCTETIVQEAISKKCNLIVAHHPILFGAIKKINGNNYVERVLIAAIKNDIAIYAIHTNLDNVANGVNKRIADKIGLLHTKILQPKQQILCKLVTYVPQAQLDLVRQAIFAVGAGQIGNYSENSFTTVGNGTFKPGYGATPFVGQVGARASVNEVKLEVLLPLYLQNAAINALKNAHPYETVAYELIKLENNNDEVGSGIIGNLPTEMNAKEMLNLLKHTFGIQVIKHTQMGDKPIRTVAVCGGAGSFLIKNAMAAGAHVYITSDIKYHEFFDADNQLLLADIGHYESEQFTIELLMEFLSKKFPTFAVLKTEVNTNPVQYFS
jgi:dinuclear metal center YbgI/SA1388 family protein